MKKYVFIDEYEQPNAIEDHEQFLKIITKLELFEDDSIIKTKNYLLDCKVEGEKRQSIIVITYDKYMFLLNDGICKAWTQINNIFYNPKFVDKE